MNHKENKIFDFCANRRQFLLTSGFATGTILLSGLPGLGDKEIEALTTGYLRKKIGQVSKLKAHKPLPFHYPDNNKFSDCFLVKLDTKAGGGVGPKKDIVAFSNFCTHMGGNTLKGGYSASDRALGPCPHHGSVFDLTRHGIIVSGHATQNIAQVLLEVDVNDIFAVGMMGLIYGRHSNL